MAKDEPKNHHYVPQFLLRGFAFGDKEQIHVFDKLANRTFVTAIRNVASEIGFYNYVVDDQVRSMEPFFARVDSDLAGVFSRIVTEHSISHLSKTDRIRLSMFASVQQLRVRNARERMQHLYDAVKAKIIALGGDPAAVQGFQEMQPADIRTASILNVSMAKDLSKHLYDKQWLLMQAPVGHTLLTSDNPVALHNMIERPGRGNLGLGVEGIEIYLPISKDLCICFFCEKLHALFVERLSRAHWLRGYLGSLPINLESIEALVRACRSGKPLLLDPENVVHHNSLQVANASRFVFSHDGDFALTRTMLTDEPQLRQPPTLNVV